ncbi:MAG TPA: hypothetical protein VIL48_17505 [Acidimicrobiales bacterium]
MVELTTHRLPTPPTPDVALLRWPAHDRKRRQLAALGRPRILLTDPGVTPPSLLDDREMWLRDGCDPATVADAIDQLGRNANLAADRPLLGEDRILRHAGRWVPIPPSQIAVVELLVRHYRRLVTPEQIRSAYTRAGRPVSSASVGALVKRLDERVAAVGLHVHRVRRRGVVLAPEAPVAVDVRSGPIERKTSDNE